MPAQPPPSSNGNGAAHKPPGPDASERRPSDASALGSTLESRMARMENMMETLVERSFRSTSQHSLERDEGSISDLPASESEAAPGFVRVGSRQCAFPCPSDYEKYIRYFFAELNPFHPCVNEADFKARSKHMRSAIAVNAHETCFLALNYIILACVDIMCDTSPVGARIKPPGWQWLTIADELVGRRSVFGSGGLDMIQYLIWQVRPSYHFLVVENKYVR